METAEISFSTTKEENEIITKIAQRAVKLAKKHGTYYNFMDASMDITAVHMNGCKLRLEELEKADDFNFAHDVFGIRGYIDRATGELTDCFLPRYSA